MITISVPGKVHLLGEHAVVYGKPALLAGINKRIFITISPSKIKKIIGIKEHREEIGKLLGILEQQIKTKVGHYAKVGPYLAEIKSQIPVGSGLGSSAALSAGFTAALLSFLKITWNKKMVFDIAYEGEKFFHGNPSGGDLAAVIEGGLLWFRKDFEFLKTFSHLPFSPHKNIKQFILINSGQPKESTKELIVKVAQFKKEFPQEAERIFNDQECLVKQMVIALRDGDEDSLIKSIKLGEKNLEELGVVGEKIKSLIREMEKIGGAAKISGGGGIADGAGVLLAYHKDIKSLSSLLLHLGFEYNKIALGEEGLRKE